MTEGTRGAASLIRTSRSAPHRERTSARTQICDREDVNASVICWSEDHDTGFHDHDQSAAAIAVISGRVREERLRIGSSPHARELGSGTVFTVAPVAIHRGMHAGDEPAVTIHAYSPPLTRTGAYRVGPGGALERRSLPLEAELTPETAPFAETTPFAETAPI